MPLSYTTIQRMGIGVLLGLFLVVLGLTGFVSYRTTRIACVDLPRQHVKEQLYSELAREFAETAMLLMMEMTGATPNKTAVLSALDEIREDLAQLAHAAEADNDLEVHRALVREERRLRTAAYAFWATSEADPSMDNAGRTLQIIRSTVPASLANAKRQRDAAQRTSSATSAELRKSLQSSVLMLVVGGSLTTGVAVAVSIALRRMLVRPIGDVLKATEALAAGDLGYRVAVCHGDDLGRLGRGINDMASRIEQTTQALQGARQQAERATRAKDAFLANMSHEIRTPMTAILGFAEQLIDPDISESDRTSAVHTILRNGEHLLGVINDILDLSKIEAGQLSVQRERCTPTAFVDEAISLIQGRAEEKGLEFSVTYESSIPRTIVTDPMRVRQILINLIGNAIKFTRAGSVQLSIRCVQNEAAPRLELDVEDTGTGLSAEQAAGLFRPFTQADVTMTREYGGTGLGLTISRGFARMLGGDVTLVRATPGGGACFRATIATGDLHGVEMLPPPQVAPRAPITKCHGEDDVLADCLQGYRLLLAEDGPDNQRLVARIIQKAGGEVVVVENGWLAVETALAQRDTGTPFDLILMDMQMPVMDGYEASGLLRQRGYDGPIVALTAHAMTHDREKCLRAGCTDHVAKPIQRQRFLATLAHHLPVRATRAN